MVRKRKKHKHMEAKQYVTKSLHQEISEEIKGEIKKYLETNDNGDKRPKTYGTQQKQC